MRDDSHLLTETEARTILDRFSALLVAAFDGALADWTRVLTGHPDETGGLTKFTRTRFIHDRVVYRLARAIQAGEAQGMRLHKKHGLYVVVLNDTLTLKLKKLNRRFRSRNTPTAQTLAFNSQTPLIASVGAMTNATGGYVADTTTAEAADIVVVCWNGPDRRWVITLRETSAETVLEIPAEPTQPEQRRTRLTGEGDKTAESSEE